MEQLSIYLPGIVLAYSAFLLSIMSPGPNILAVIGTSMSVGRRSGTALALGVGTGSVCWAVLTVAGLSALLTAYAGALTIIKIVGAPLQGLTPPRCRVASRPWVGCYREDTTAR